MMTILYSLSALDTLEHEYAALFLLIDFTVKSTAILSLAFLLAFQLRKQSAADKSALWMIAISSLLLLPFFHELVPILPVSLAINESTFANMILVGLQGIGLTFSDSNPGLSTSVKWVVIAYVTISILLALYLILGIVRVVILTKNAIRLHDQRAHLILNRLMESNGISSDVELLRCASCVSPLTWGIRKHKILLPASIQSWSNELLEQTLSHELAHIQRKDWLCYIFSRFAICLYWINPLVWLAHGNLVMESEKSCDDAVVDDTGCPFSYAENLLHLANSFRLDCTIPVTSMFAKQSSLTYRIRYILSARDSGRRGDRSCLISGLLVAAVLVAPFSALNISVQIIERGYSERIQESITIPVNFIPRDSIEYIQYMTELGRA